ncbi:MAG TPA: ClpXP protease specificity-enhancing factor SspB [Thermohalobaculum sp.]|nr:ClpXP protease specificity-enhancing factor SspB [Thermohalobaculum sp.]
MTSSKSLNYGRYMEKAMRGVMAEVLGHVARHGLPGDHYFYITFETGHPGVDIPDWLRERYPNETMIVLQEWFEDLAVMGDRFRVTLNFSNQPETLVIPFDAVKTFVDPSAKFGLKFDDHESDEMVLDVDDIADERAADQGARDAVEGAPEDDPDGTDGGKPRTSADVVSLDRFRKG